MSLHPWWPEGLGLHPHLIFELLAFSIGFQLFWALRRRQGDVVVDPLVRIWLLASATAGAALGAKGLALFVDPAHTLAHLGEPVVLFAGRSIVGALLGGLAAVELAKRWMSVSVATGDLYVVPLCVGIAVGRIGCFFSGVGDGTHGIETSLPWGMDLGDGLARHPTALYEIGALSVLGAVLGRWRPARPGDRFRAFMVGYLAWRLGIEALKTQPFPYAGLSAIQVAALGGLLYYAGSWARASRQTSSPR